MSMYKVILPLLTLSACQYDGDLLIENLKGTVVLPESAGTRFVNGEAIISAQNIGPVYLGLYPAVTQGGYSYPHPQQGPLIQENQKRDTYPYGGTTIGDHRFACVEALRCRVLSGRFTDFDQLIDWFTIANEIEIIDALGVPMTSGAELRQICYDLLEVTSDEDVRITASDRNADGVIDESDLDFQQREDGSFEASFTIWQQEFFANTEGSGFTLWGFMERPELTVDPGTNATFSNTCVVSSEDGASAGFPVNVYNQEWDGGRQAFDILNYPYEYIEPGDFVSGAQDDEGTLGFTFTSVLDEPELLLNVEVQ